MLCSLRRAHLHPLTGLPGARPPVPAPASILTHVKARLGVPGSQGLALVCPLVPDTGGATPQVLCPVVGPS